MDQPKWKIPAEPDKSTDALLSAGYSPLLSRVLLSRGISTPAEAAAFLGKDKALLSDPMALTDMGKAVKRIERAIAEGESLAVYGDYDVDGITASCLLCDYLTRRGVSCRIYIPDRIDEGYGLNTEALEALKASGVDLVITVDCGITALEETEFAKALGLDIIITDHHECPPCLPGACAVVDPKRPENAGAAADLAGVGVAFKLVCALEGDFESALSNYADLVAVGTVADVMPLTGENRVLVSCGLEKLKNNPRPGFAALLQESGAAEKVLSAGLISFSLAPRINAAGRLCQTSKSVELLMCRDPKTAEELALELCELNRRRQALELQVWQDSMEILSENPPSGPIILADENWHPGVVGIAASRLAEEFCLPAVMICLDGENGKGSCRSYGDFNLFDGLAACSGLLEGFGGHAFAAGLTIKKDKIDEFRTALTAYFRAHPSDFCSAPEPEVLLSDLSLLTMEGVASLDMLEPCGSGNPKPLFCIRDSVLEGVSPIGGGKHLRIQLGKGRQSIDCVFFSCSQEELNLAQGDMADVCFTPQINEFRSHKSVQLLVAEVRASENLKLCRELLSQEEIRPELCENENLSRQDMALVWRGLRRHGAQAGIKIAELFSPGAFEPLPSVKVCLALRVFAELSLLSVKSHGKMPEIIITDNGEKANLENSVLFKRLSAE